MPRFAPGNIRRSVSTNINFRTSDRARARAAAQLDGHSRRVALGRREIHEDFGLTARQDRRLALSADVRAAPSDNGGEA